MKLALCFLALVGVATAAKSYDGYKVIRVWPARAETLAYLKKATDADVGVALWTDIGHLGHPVDLSASPKAARLFLETLKNKKVNFEILIEDLQKQIDDNMADNEMAKMNKMFQGASIDNSYYRTLAQINAELDLLETTYPDLYSSYNNGDPTYNGNNVRVEKVSAGGNDTRPAIFMDCGIHAREWVSSATCLFILDQLSTYGTAGADEVTDLLDTYDFHIIVNTNPDGYEFTWTDDRLWRKNRVPYKSAQGLNCFGCDCNRNFDANFGGVGSSNITCADTYHGPSAFSEAESRACRDALTALGSRTKMAFSLHAYSQYWMTPYGYTFNLPAAYEEMMRVSAIGVNALMAVYLTPFQYGSIATIIYEASGGTVDWYYDTMGIVYPFALELRDTGKDGFVLPPDQIVPTATETWAGIKAAINAVV